MGLTKDAKFMLIYEALTGKNNTMISHILKCTSQRVSHITLGKRGMNDSVKEMLRIANPEAYKISAIAAQLLPNLKLTTSVSLIQRFLLVRDGRVDLLPLIIELIKVSDKYEERYMTRIAQLEEEITEGMLVVFAEKIDVFDFTDTDKLNNLIEILKNYGILQS